PASPQLISSVRPLYKDHGSRRDPAAAVSRLIRSIRGGDPAAPPRARAPSTARDAGPSMIPRNVLRAGPAPLTLVSLGRRASIAAAAGSASGGCRGLDRCPGSGGEPSRQSKLTREGNDAQTD